MSEIITVGIVLRKKLRRVQLVEFFSHQAAFVVVIDECGAATASR